MKRIILFLFTGLFLSFQLSAQTGFTDDFEDGSQDWWDNGYALNESDGNLKITSRSRGTWRAFGYDLSTAVDVSSNEIMNLTLKTNDLTPCKLTAYISDGTNNVPITKRVLPTENYITLHYDFSGDGDIDYTNITQIFFSVNGNAQSWSGDLWFEEVSIGTDASELANIGGIRNKEYAMNGGSKEILITDIENAGSLTWNGSSSLIENVAFTAIADGMSTMSFDLTMDATGTETITVTANGSGAYNNNSIQFELTIEDNLPPVIDAVANQQMANSETQTVQLSGIGDGNVSMQQDMSVTASSDNQGVIANGDIAVDYTSDQPNAVVSYTASSTGTANITVTVTDDGATNNTTSAQFEVEVFASINQTPTIEPISDTSMFHDSPQQTITLTGISDGDEGTQNLTVTAESSDPGVVTIDDINYTNGQPTAELLYSYGGSTGTVTITVTVSDDGGTAGNNGDTSTVSTFEVKASTAPYAGYAFEFDSGTEGFWAGGTGNSSMSASGGLLIYDVDKDPFDPFGVNFNPHLDMSDHPYITVRARATDNVEMAMWFFDDNGNYNNNSTQRMNVTTSWSTFTFDYTEPDERMTGGGTAVDFTDIVSLHCLVEPGSSYTGTVEVDFVRCGDEADLPTATVKMDSIADQVLYEGAATQTIMLSGISDGDTDDDAVVITASSDNTGLIPDPTVSSVTNKTAVLTYVPGAGTGSATITVTANATNSNPLTVPFKIEIISPDPGVAETVSVDYATTYQTIEGFGAYANSPDFMDELANDLGASAVRLGFIGNQLELENDNADPYVLNRDALNYDVFDWDYLRQLHENGVENFILTSWSPPAWMKENLSEDYGYAATNNWSTTDNKLNTYHYDEFAEMCVAAVRLLKEEAGIDLYGWGPQNEPAFCEPYPSAILDPAHFPIVVNEIADRFRSEGIDTRLFMPEQVFSQGFYSMEQYIDACQADAASDSNTYAIATHGYASDGVGEGSAGATEWQDMWNNAQEGSYPKAMWMTETSGGDNIWANILRDAGSVHDALEYGNVSLWTYWSFHVSSGSAGYGLIAGETKTPRYFAFKNFAKFIRPGAVRLDNSATDANLLVTAFKNDAAHDNKLVIVVINKNNTPVSTLVDVTNGDVPNNYEVYQTAFYKKCEYMGTVSKDDPVALPANSITTLVAINNLTPTIDKVNDQKVIAGSGVQTINLSGITDGGDGGQTISVTASSSDNGVVSGVSVDYTSPNNTAVLSYNPVGAAGELSTISVLVKDDGGTTGGGTDSVKISFSVEIYSDINEVPTIDGIANQNIFEDDGEQTIALSGISDGDGWSQNVTIEATSSSPGLIPHPTIDYTSGDNTGTLTYTPVADENGTANITVTVTDDGGSATNNGDQQVQVSFLVNVEPVNDPSTYAVTFTVNDDNADPLEGAIVTVNGQTDTSGTNGQVSFLLPDGQYDYTVTAEGYEEYSDQLTVSGAALPVEVDLTPSDVNEVFVNKLTVYPNPANNYVNIELPDASCERIIVMDNSGKILMNRNIADARGILKISINDWKSGYYYVQILTIDVVYKAELVVE